MLLQATAEPKGAPFEWHPHLGMIRIWHGGGYHVLHDYRPAKDLDSDAKVDNELDPFLTASKDLGSDAEDNNNLDFYTLFTNIELPTPPELFGMSSRCDHGSAFLDQEISMSYEDEENYINTMTSLTGMSFDYISRLVGISKSQMKS